MLSKIFNSLKKAFKDEEHEEIFYKDLSEWFDAKQKESEEDFNEKIQLEIKNLKNRLRSFNKDLMSLSQKNPDDKYPEVTKEKIKDSIIEYVSKSKRFIKKIFATEDEKDKFLTSVNTFFENLKEYENDIKEQKEFLEDIFNQEMKDCEDSLEELKEYFTKLQKRFKSTESKNTQDIKSKIDEMLQMDQKRSELEQKKERIQENLKKIEELKEKFLDKIESLKSSPDFGKFHETVNKRRIALDKITEIKELFEHDFSKLKSAIKQHHLKNYRKILKKYLENPFEALLEDEGEKFADQLPEIKRNIEADEIRLATDNKRSAVETIKKLNKSYLYDLVQEHNQAREDKKRLDKVLSTNKVMSDYSELEYKIDHTNKKIKDQKEVLKEVKTELENLNITKLTSEIEKLLGETFDTNIMITFEKNEPNTDNEEFSE